MKIYTKRELCEKWAVSDRTIDRMRVPRGPLRWLRIRGGVRFTQEHVDEYEANTGAALHLKEMEKERAREAARSGSFGVAMAEAARRGREAARKLAAPKLTPEERGTEAARRSLEWDAKRAKLRFK
jgi:hypothetical protein